MGYDTHHTDGREEQPSTVSGGAISPASSGNRPEPFSTAIVPAFPLSLAFPLPTETKGRGAKTRRAEFCRNRVHHILCRTTDDVLWEPRETTEI